MAKRFTLYEAEELLPEIERLLRQAIQLKDAYQQAEQELQALLQRIMQSGGMVVDRQIVLQARLRRDSVGEPLKKALEGIQSNGCVVKDLNIGLVDFPTLFRGEEVYLCWKLGETAIEYWHGMQEGFAGRKAIDADFRENHRGDPKQ
jgi:hypothetical protein